jgi:heat shock protein HslJ
MMHRAGIILGVFASAALIGCTAAGPGVETPSLPPPHELTQQTWNLVEITQRDAWPIRLSPAQQVRHQLQFGAGGRLALTLDCNRGIADWSASWPDSGSGTLSIGPIAATRALCQQPSYGEAMASDLHSARGFTILSGSGQSLNILTRNKVYIFMAVGVAGQLPGDAVDPATGYHATAPVACSFAGRPPVSSCEAGVKRKWGEDGTTLVEVMKPDGRKRAIYFQGTNAYGADSAQADGSAGWTFRATRRPYETVITYGPEEYVIPDALVVGG